MGRNSHFGAFALALLVGAIGFTVRTVASVWPKHEALVQPASSVATPASAPPPASSQEQFVFSPPPLPPKKVAHTKNVLTPAPSAQAAVEPASFSNRTTGDCSPIVTGSSASANPDCSKHYAGPPPANLTFTENVITPLSDHIKKTFAVHVRTDRAIPAAAVAIFFSAPITFTKEYFAAHPARLDGASIQSMDISGPLTGEGTFYPNSLAVIVNVPAAFTAGQEMVLTVESESDAHVIRVMAINMGRIP